jgi:signal transduction histidine kinase/ligand-binding sensor domain-containing protein/CheY-like chemotaxis protein
VKIRALLLLILFTVVEVSATIYAPYFKNITIENGLSNNTVRTITKDADGFMWFGTYDGLCRYDGMNFKTYRKDGNNQSLNSNQISYLYSTAQNELYVGTRKGLNLFNQKNETFNPVQFREFGTDTIRNSTTEICSILEDEFQNIYVATIGNGLLVHNSKEKEFKQIAIIGNNRNLSVRSMAITSNKLIYMGIDDYGIYKLDIETGIATLVTNSILQTQCIYNYQGKMLIGTFNGLYALDTHTGTVNKFLELPELSRSIQYLKEDINHVLWICTESNGIVLYDTKKKSIQHIPAGYGNSLLSSEGTYCVYTDDKNMVWIGMMRGGVEEWNPNQKPFYSRRNTKSNSPASNFITCFVEIDQNTLWIGSDGGGMQQFDLQKDDFFENDIQHRINSIAGKAVISMVKDQYQNIWMGTYGNGLIKYNLSTHKLESYTTENSTIKSNYVWSLFIDREKNLWIGCVLNQGLFRYNYDKNTVESINIEQKNIISIFQSNNNEMILGGYSSVIVYEPNIQKSITYSAEGSVRAICQDKTGTIWIGTEGAGIFNFIAKTGELIPVKSSLSYLAKSNIMAIVEDDQSNLWISTANGLFRYNYSDETLTTYDKRDGLQSGQFLYSSVLKTKSNKLFFGGINGFSFFDPKKITTESEKIPLRVSDFSIHNRSIFSDILKNSEVIDMLSDKDIKIKYKDAYIRFDFTAISFENPEKIQYSYILEGHDKNWNNSGSNRSANYSGLKQGKYTFKVRCTTQPNNWNDNILEIQLTVLPPFYQTWWAFIFYFVVILGIIYTAISIQKSENRLKQNLLLADLKEEQIKQVQQMREQFFINISHELRTPLTLIIPPIKDSLNSNPYTPLSQIELKSVFNNANRLLQLINKLLLFRKSENSKNQLKVVQTDIVDFAGKIHANFSQIADKRNITYRFTALGEPIVFWFDKDKMEVILYNLLSNAFKFTPDFGEIELGAHKTADNLLTIYVRDNGSGIAPKDLEHIFNRFYTSNEHSGFGIGLSLVKNYVEMLHGKLMVDSEVGKGSSFYMNFDLDAQYAQNEIDNDQTITHMPSEDMVELINDDTQHYLNQNNNEIRKLTGTTMPKILLVEDNLEILMYMKKILLGTGRFEVYEALNGKMALKTALKIFPDMIISDIHMPEMNGLELCRAIKENIETNHIYYILITADIYEATESKGFQFGADEFITKPFDKIKLINKISTIFNYQQKIRKYFENRITLGKQNIEPNSINAEFIDKCINIVRSNYSSDDFSLQALVQQTNMSQSALYKKIKLCTGKSINEFIRTVKLSIASELILEGKMNITEIANEIGIYDPKYFRECFKKQYGVNPSEFKKQH